MYLPPLQCCLKGLSYRLVPFSTLLTAVLRTITCFSHACFISAANFSSSATRCRRVTLSPFSKTSCIDSTSCAGMASFTRDSVTFGTVSRSGRAIVHRVLLEIHNICLDWRETFSTLPSILRCRSLDCPFLFHCLPKVSPYRAR